MRGTPPRPGPARAQAAAGAMLGAATVLLMPIVGLAAAPVLVLPALLAGVLAGPALAGALASYRRDATATRDERLAQVDRFTSAVGRHLEVGAVAEQVVRGVAASLAVERVQLRLELPLRGPQDWVLDPAGLRRGRAALVGPATERAEAGHCLLPPGSTEAAALGVRELLMVPLTGVGQVCGHLLVADRQRGAGGFTAADTRQLRVLANHAAVALENAVRAETIIAQVERREREALHDELTGAGNRRLLRRELAGRLRAGGAALLLLGLDRFREVNDTLGHETGDRLLRLVAERLARRCPRDALVARLGGDEFAVLLRGADRRRAERVAVLVRDTLARPVALGTVTVAVDVSVGLAVAGPGADPESVLRRADLAMVAAKSRCTGVEVYRPGLDRGDTGGLGLLADLRDAVAAGTLEVHYQPKLDLRSGAVTGVEALARWWCPGHGQVPPDRFIPLAERSPLITPLTLLVLRRALADLRRWRRVHGGLSVAVNVSPRSLLAAGFVEAVGDAVAAAGLPPGCLTLEITETSLMVDPGQAVAALRRLRAAGIRLAVDDLGTGYSSLAYLQRLPVDEVKIDRSFVGRFEDEAARAVVAAIVELGHRLGRVVVAEGVETRASYDALRELGCDGAQGYWVAPPMAAGQVAGFLRARTGADRPGPAPGRLSRPDPRGPGGRACGGSGAPRPAPAGSGSPSPTRRGR